MLSYTEKLERNITISYIYNIFMFFRITNAIWLLYLSSKGLTLFEIGILESIFHITSFCCEIPTGAIADLYGRKFSVILGRVSAILSTILMITCNSMIGLSIAFVLSGLSYTLNSGAGEALTYDSLKLLDMEKEYKRIYGLIYFFTELSQGAAVILGGILSDKRFFYAYLAALIIEVLTLCICTTFTEPIIEKEREHKNSFRNQVNESFVILKERRLVLYLILFFALITTIGTIVYLYCQKYFENLHFTKTFIAVIFTLDNLINALSSKYAYKLENRMKQTGIILLLSLLNIVGIAGLAFTKGYVTILFFLLSSFAAGLTYPLFSDYINSLIPSAQRATILSFESASFSTMMAILFPLVGWVGGKIGLSLAFGLAGFLFIPFLILILFKIKKYKSHSNL